MTAARNFGQKHEFNWISQKKKKSSVKLGIQILYAVDQFTSLFSR